MRSNKKRVISTKRRGWQSRKIALLFEDYTQSIFTGARLTTANEDGYWEERVEHQFSSYIPSDNGLSTTNLKVIFRLKRLAVRAKWQFGPLDG